MPTFRITTAPQGHAGHTFVVPADSGFSALDKALDIEMDKYHVPIRDLRPERAIIAELFPVVGASVPCAL